ncbi:MAG TPA: META domain-containing protein [Acidimicrobiia bacterium]
MEGNWTVVEFDCGDDLQPPIPGSVITMEFVGERVSGNAGVNRYSASLVDGNLGPIASTMMAGPPELMEQESRFLALLDRCDGLLVEDDLLRLSTGGRDIATLARRSDQLTGIKWQLSGYDNGSGGFVSSLITQLVTAEFNEDGSVSGSGGCNRYRATYQVEKSSLSFGPAMSTRMACPDIGIMEQETRYFALLERVRSYKHADNHGQAGLEMFDEYEIRILSLVVASKEPDRPGTGHVDSNV